MGAQAPGSLFSALSPLTCGSLLPLQGFLPQDHLPESLSSLLWVSSDGMLLGGSLALLIPLLPELVSINLSGSESTACPVSPV